MKDVQQNDTSVSNTLLGQPGVTAALLKARAAQDALEEARKLYEEYELGLDEAEIELRAALKSSSVAAERDRAYAEALLQGSNTTGRFDLAMINPDMTDEEYRAACRAILAEMPGTSLATEYPDPVNIGDVRFRLARDLARANTVKQLRRKA